MTWLSLFLLASIAFTPPQGSSLLASNATPTSAADSMERKLDWLSENGAREHPDDRTTELTEAEVNDYLAQRRVKLPAGVRSVKMTAVPGTIMANAIVDFDQITAQRNTNPLLEIFHGIHQIDVDAEAYGFNRIGRVHVQWVKVDGVQVPETILNLFVKRFVTAKYPNIGIDSEFQLPAKIDQATVRDHKVALHQE